MSGWKRKRTLEWEADLPFIMSFETPPSLYLIQLLLFILEKLRLRSPSYHLWVTQHLLVPVPNGFSGFYFFSGVNNADSRLLHCSN